MKGVRSCVRPQFPTGQFYVALVGGVVGLESGPLDSNLGPTRSEHCASGLPRQA